MKSRMGRPYPERIRMPHPRLSRCILIRMRAERSKMKNSWIVSLDPNDDIGYSGGRKTMV